MKRFITVVTLMLFIIGCSTLRPEWTKIGKDGVMLEITDDTVSLDGFKMLCEKDTLATDLNQWVSFSYTDYNNKIIEQWLYIKDTDTNTVYILSAVTDSTYRFVKRTIIEEETK